MPSFGEKSNEVRDTLTPTLQLLVDRVVKYYNITLLEGHRNERRQDALLADQVTKVGWPDSKHNAFPSMAVDVSPWPIPEGWGNLGRKTGKVRDDAWKERVKFYQMVAVIQYCWAQLVEEYPDLNEYQLRSGADWDGDGDYRDQTFDDLVHVELRRKH